MSLESQCRYSICRNTDLDACVFVDFMNGLNMNSVMLLEFIKSIGNIDFVRNVFFKVVPFKTVVIHCLSSENPCRYNEIHFNENIW